MKGFTTKAIHGAPVRKDVNGALRMPVYDSAAFEFDCSTDIQMTFEGQRPAHVYSRTSNPTIEDFEQRVRLLTDALGVIAVSSGMAAITNVIFALAEPGTEIVTSPFLFGNTYSLFESTFKSWGLNVKYVDMTRPDTVTTAITEKTRAVFLESITNPQLEVADLREISRITRECGVPLVLDGTLTSPFILKSNEYDVDLEVVSGTKFFSGGATSVSGVIIDNGSFDWRRNPKLRKWADKFGSNAMQYFLRKEIYRNTGSCLSPHNAFLQSLGLETISLRVSRSCENALTVARFLDSHSKVRSVNYPGIESSPSHKTAKKQFRNGFGSLLTFDMDSRQECYHLMDRLELIKRATNMCDNKSLIIHPASTIYSEFTQDEKDRMGIRDTMIRFSVGIEDIEDITDDLSKALEGI